MLIWHQILRGKRIERSFGSNFCAGSKSNRFLVPPPDGGANRTAFRQQLQQKE